MLMNLFSARIVKSPEITMPPAIIGLAKALTNFVVNEVAPNNGTQVRFAG